MRLARLAFWVCLIGGGCDHASGGGGDAGGDGPPAGGCPSGTHEVAGSCVLDEGCSPASCSGHGLCSETDGVASCACDGGWAAPRCQTCATGFHDDNTGGCTSDPCKPDPCGGGERRCVADNGKATCVCMPGYHDDGGACVPDTTCMPTSCNGHGTCMDGAGQIACACEAGWAGSRCMGCDKTAGYHDDGQGGCSTDTCKPNPCTESHKTVCTVSMLGQAACGCDPGYHLAGSTCVVDETCQPQSCSGHGSCQIAGGVVQCSCAAGYTGASCAGCDTAGGYHADGLGGCTEDACVPNPCTQLHKTVCTGAGVCGCDAGFHDDGQGGCTGDPCTPNPCLASNRACRVTNNLPECYTPACDDGNPCTDDTVSGGACQHAMRGNGSPCTTSLCQVGQTCQGGTCSAGTARDCADANPCTADSCSPTAGCQHANDNTLVPSDGLDCTVDSCSAGVAAHTPSHAACDDALWCTGTEVCSPGAGADARGCRHTNVPEPPANLGPCRTAGACSEATHSFPLSDKTAGLACSDGIACTSSDRCDGTGACRGTPGASCGTPGSCAGTTPLATPVDVPWGEVSGTMTMAGGALPASHNDYTGGDFYLVAKDTAVPHYIGGFRYNYQSSGVYVLASNTYLARLVTGVYDLVYRRNCGPTAADSCYNKVDAGLGPMVNGYRVLQRNVVVGPGHNRLDIDLPKTDLSGAMTMNGGALPATHNDYTGGDFYLLAKDTSVPHYIGGFRYNYQSSGVYVLAATTYAARVLPGTYDLAYRRNCGPSPSDGCYNKVDAGLGPMVNGYRILRRNVAVAGTSQTLDLDVPKTDLTGTMTMNGGALPATHSDYTGGDFYLVAKDTSVPHYIGGFRYNYQSSGVYVLAATTYAARVLPGTYDLAYRRNCGPTPSDSCYNKVDAGLGPMVNGYRILARDVVVAGTTQTLDLDVPKTDLSGTMTMNGGALPATHNDYTGGDFYLVAQDTAVPHYIGGFRYNYQSSGVYVLAATTYAARVLPGTYDLVYRRNCGPKPTDSCFNRVDAGLGPMVNGYRVLTRNVVVAGTTQTLDLDVPKTDLSGAMTMNGGALPATHNDYTGGDFYLVARDTAVPHYIGGFRYNYQSSGVYVLAASSYAARVLPGTYDLVYRRNCGPSASDGCYNKIDAGLGPMVNGYRVLRRDVAISGLAQTLDLDVPKIDLAGSITMNGGPLPAQFTDYTGGDLYLVARDTAVPHYIGGFRYNYQSSGVYVLAGSDYAARVLPGTYDLVYRRNCGPKPSDSCYNKVDSGLGPMVNGYRVLAACLATP